MLPTMFGCAAQGSAAPLALSISNPGDVGINVPPGVQGGSSNAGEIASTATATGGDGSYTYAWTLSEIDDLDQAFSINSQGTTTNATYNTATVSTNYNNNIPPPPPPPPPQASYRVSCTVTDGNGDTATATADFAILVA